MAAVKRVGLGLGVTNFLIVEIHIVNKRPLTTVIARRNNNNNKQTNNNNSSCSQDVILVVKQTEVR